MIQNDPDNPVLDEQPDTTEVVASAGEPVDEIEKNGDEIPPASESITEDIATDSVDVPEVIQAEESLLKTEKTIANDVSSEENEADNSLPPVDYSGYSKKELSETLALLVENRYPAEIKDDIDSIKGLFYKKLKQESDARKAEFLAGGGKIEEYRPWIDPEEAPFKLLLEKYRDKKTDHSKILDAEKNENLKKKYEIIDKIKDLVNKEESINKTFQDFKSLQNEWYNIGVVPQSALKNMWENYHHSVEFFYSYIKINKELRDLDLKKNQELKTGLCEKTEALSSDPNPLNAFRILQEYHDQWREIGPAPMETKDILWERFKEATSKINKKHHEYFENQKEDQKKNLDSKIALCIEAEKINSVETTSLKDFDANAEKIIELQKKWRTVGFAPKKQNTKVYQRFRETCDAFFEKRRQFYADNKDTQMKNLQIKTDLCIKAEALQESSDWKSTSDAFIKLQKEWKEVGPTPKKYSERCWKRFRKACDRFFDRKTSFFGNLDNSYEDNLRSKLEIIEDIEKLSSENNVQAAVGKIKELQKKWNETGFVPFDKKEEVANRYRNAIDSQFDRLKIGDEAKNIMKYKTKLDSLKTNPQVSRKIRSERDKFITQIKQLESEVVILENNISFFAKSVKAESMIRSVEEKIKNAKNLIKTLEGKVRIIDQSGLDE
ncbi:MAG: DUF349 domain-containing protein [Bacteroidales bacterium]|jgi:hypothetical protein|nr:DUF349 domain-containing protein [Bacteroidales bacterium]